MTSPAFTNDSAFEETGISPTVTADDASRFFLEHGIFFVADAEIGRQVKALGAEALRADSISKFEDVFMKDPRLRQVIEPFVKTTPYVAFALGASPTNFFAFTILPNQDNRAIIYMWNGPLSMEFSYGSHTCALKGVQASNGMTQVPHKGHLKNLGLKDIKIRMEEGGIVITHPRLAFQVEKGFAIGYGCQKAE